MRIMMWMCCIEASAGIYESTRLGGQGSRGYIWQSIICISTTTKYTLIMHLETFIHICLFCAVISLAFVFFSPLGAAVKSLFFLGGNKLSSELLEC